MTTTIKDTGRACADTEGDICYALTPWSKGRSNGFEFAKFIASVRKTDGRLIWRKQGVSPFCFEGETVYLRRSGCTKKFLTEVQAVVDKYKLPYARGLRHNDPANA